MDNYESLRERTLWFPPVPPPGYKSRQTSLQSQSPIFAMLPPEIRRLIWIGCLGGFTLSLDFSSQHICDWFQSIFSGVDESEAEIWRELKYLGPRRIDVEPGLLPILLTCQRVCESRPYHKQIYCTIIILETLLQILGSHRHPLLLQWVQFTRHKLSILHSRTPLTAPLQHHSLSRFHRTNRRDESRPWPVFWGSMWRLWNLVDIPVQHDCFDGKPSRVAHSDDCFASLATRLDPGADLTAQSS